MPAPMTKNRKLLPPNLTIAELLKRKTLEQLLEDGDLYTPEDAAPIMGYAVKSVHRLCRQGEVERVKHGGRYYLYSRTVHGTFEHLPTGRPGA